MVNLHKDNKALKPAIILVNPQLGENIGATARVMANFALSDLRIVNPRDGWPNEQAISMAKNAKELIHNAKIFNSLSEAIKDINLLFATTTRERQMAKEVLTAKETIAHIYSKLQLKTAIMFGGERSGLSNEDTGLADFITTIPVGEDYDSLNLAQAVCILCYEYFNYDFKKAPKINFDDNLNTANKDEVLGLFNHLETELLKTNFFKLEAKREKMVINLRNSLMRSNLNKQDVRTLRGVIRALVTKEI